MTDINLHDAEITGIEHDEASQELILKATHPSGEKYQIVFLTVEWWELCSFGVQNVLFSIAPFDKHSLTKGIIVDQDIPDQYAKMVSEGDYVFFIIKASIGLEGWVLAAEMRIDPV
ncbi:hypothetical protein GO755_07860 [Spirosoma sp. HMF4905]|uniref:Uncharacterized protein n=1 Tax=Spirosoma arboris TaxID=2682092 RepID=A0A7K1S7X8_9BACT|nr:hypothetical protein [Spirosoma arboris]MVM29943.1 hypothetical protein [Spirosoma arboris]